MLTAARLRQLFRYDPETGLFTRQLPAGGQPIGAVVRGHDNGKGYLQFKVDGINYRAHRLAWLHEQGEWPEGELDHRDGDKGNNRLANLRPATRSGNLQNLRKALSNNRLGLLGVTQTSEHCFIARINVDGDRQYIGAFHSAAVAHEAYLAAKRQLHQGNTL